MEIAINVKIKMIDVIVLFCERFQEENYEEYLRIYLASTRLYTMNRL